MENPTNTPEDQTAPNAAEELAALKAKADLLGVTYKSNIGIETLREKINKHLADKEAEETQTPAGKANDDEANDEDEDAPLTRAELRQKLHKEEMRLIRCKIYNLNPAKRDLHGEIITILHPILGTVRKFVPFGEATENGFHIPYILFKDLKSRRFQQLRRVGKGDKARIEPRMVPEYSLEEMEPLTEKELTDLAVKQAAAQRLSDD